MYDMQRIISKHQHTDGLIALFPQHQMSGNVSYDFGPNQGHGTLSNVSSRYSDHSVPKGHFMNASSYSWKVSSYNDIYTTALRDAFNGDAGAIVSFCKTDSSWTALANQYVVMLRADANNLIFMRKDAAANKIYFRYRANSVGKSMDVAGMTTTDWFCMAMMWDRLVNDEVRVYLDGAYQTRGITLPTWAGNLAATTTVIGASENDGSDGWLGGIGITAIYNTIKSDDEMLYLSKP